MMRDRSECGGIGDGDERRWGVGEGIGGRKGERGLEVRGGRGGRGVKSDGGCEWGE